MWFLVLFVSVLRGRPWRYDGILDMRWTTGERLITQKYASALSHEIQLAKWWSYMQRYYKHAGFDIPHALSMYENANPNYRVNTKLWKLSAHLKIIVFSTLYYAVTNFSHLHRRSSAIAMLFSEWIGTIGERNQYTNRYFCSFY